MNKVQYKQGLQAEIKAAGFTTNSLNQVGELSADHGYKTVLYFDKAVGQDLFKWLDNRFTAGVKRHTGMDSWIIINSPNEGTKYLPGTLVTITDGAFTNAVGEVIDKDTVFIFGSGKFKFTAKSYRIAEANEVMDKVLTNHTIKGIEIVEAGKGDNVRSNGIAFGKKKMIIKTSSQYDIHVIDDMIFLVGSMQQVGGNYGQILTGITTSWLTTVPSKEN